MHPWRRSQPSNCIFMDADTKKNYFFFLGKGYEFSLFHIICVTNLCYNFLWHAADPYYLGFFSSTQRPHTHEIPLLSSILTNALKSSYMRAFNIVTYVENTYSEIWYSHDVQSKCDLFNICVWWWGGEFIVRNRTYTCAVIWLSEYARFDRRLLVRV